VQVAAIAHDMAAFIWAIAREVPMARYTPCLLMVHPHALGGILRRTDERQPRFGAILAGVKRLQETPVPRSRQAPDGYQSGGIQPTDPRVVNRRDV
jgi:hypothetical protein